MKLLIDSSNFDKENHLAYDGKNYFWTSEIGEDCFVMCGNPKKEYSIEHACSLLGIEAPSILEENQKKSFKELNLQSSRIPSIFIYPPDKFKQRLKKVTEWASDLYEDLDEYSYLKVFRRELDVLLGMEPALFDTTSFNRWCLGKNIDKKLKNSFSVNRFGYLQKTVYNNFSTRTGRIVTQSGPQFLTASKEIRGFLKSRYKNGKIVQLDFVSLEPRVALYAAKQSFVKDVYSMLNEVYFANSLERSQIKKLVLCSLYGAGTRTLKKILPENISPSKAVKDVRASMNFEALVKRKKEELEKESTMTNFFGRKIVPSSDRDAIIFNNWVQSSAVDVSLLGFSNLLKSFREDQLKFNPLFLIHDALIIDASEEMIEKLESNKEINILIKDLGHFPLSVEYLSGN